MRRDGGPAFPGGVNNGTFTDREQGEPTEHGMSLRDYFAAKALQGYLAAYSGTEVKMPPPDHAAKWAFAYADAMLAEREKVPA